jgi:glycolate oxidase FAD binding subunit
MGVIPLDEFATAVGTEGSVTIAGLGTRGGPVPGVRAVAAPAGVEWVQADEMIVSCGAGTPVDQLVEVLRPHGQTVALPKGGTVGGALAVGLSDVCRLGHGPVRDVLLQARYVSASGEIVKAGGPTVKNVSGFDLCRVLVGSRGTLGFLGDVILRTRPLPQVSQWFSMPCTDPSPVFARLYRPASVLWNGSSIWVLLEGHRLDVQEQAEKVGLHECSGPPVLPTGSRRSISPAAVTSLTGEFVAELGVGIVHHAEAWTAPTRSDRVVALAKAMKAEFDPTGRLNPDVDV